MSGSIRSRGKPTKPVGDARTLGKRDDRIRLGAYLAFIGLAMYGAMFVGFGITDEDLTEVIGGLGIILAAFGVLIALRGFAPRR